MKRIHKRVYEKTNKHVPTSTNSGGPGLEHCSLPQDGFVFGGPRFNSSTLVNNQLVSLPPTEIFNTFLFNSQYLLAYFIVPNYFSAVEHLDTEMTRLIFEFLFSLYQFTAAISAGGW